jgi:probable FeS assembly SUF system protein SufT
MQTDGPIPLTRDVEAIVVPIGTKATLQKGQKAYLTQSLGGTYTVVVNGNMFRIDAQDADALGLEVAAKPASTSGTPATPEALEKQVWDALRTCYDPEIPVNIVDLGLVYDCTISPLPEGGSHRAEVNMTLTAPGCGMGPMIAQEVQTKMLSIDGIDAADVELVWDPPWNQSMITEAARLQLGLY